MIGWNAVLDKTTYEIITRKEAKARGLSNYFHGRPCGRGHVAPRSVSSQYCIQCRSEIYYKNPANKEKKRLAYWKEGGKEKRRALNLKKQYGMTVAEYNAMALAQDFRCAICHDPADLATKKLAVDHDHKTDKIRDLLCMNCNLGLGAFGDDIDRMKKAIAYVLRHRRR